jgi:hypothetical protein
VVFTPDAGTLVVSQGYAGPNHLITTGGYGGIVYPSVFGGDKTGPISGGTRAIIYGNPLLMDALADTFPGVTLDPSWTPSTSGSGSVSVNDALYLSTGAAPGSASVTSTLPFFDFDITVQYSYNKDALSVWPQSDIKFYTFKVASSVNEYVVVDNYWSAQDQQLLIAVTVYSDGSPIYTAKSTTASNRGTLRVVRLGSKLYVYSGTALILKYAWLPFISSISLSTSHTTTLPSGLELIVTEFRPNIIVALGDTPCDRVSSLGTRIYFTSPTVEVQGDVPISIHGPTSIYVLDQIFTYVLDSSLTISDNTNVRIVGDSTIRDVAGPTEFKF